MSENDHGASSTSADRAGADARTRPRASPRVAAPTSGAEITNTTAKSGSNRIAGGQTAPATAPSRPSPTIVWTAAASGDAAAAATHPTVPGSPAPSAWNRNGASA